MNPNNQQPFNTTPPASPEFPQQQPVAEPFNAAPQQPPMNNQFNAASQPPQQFIQQEDPGKGLAIAGIIFALFIPLIGLILSIVAKKKSRAAGIENGLAKAGVIINGILFGLQVLVAIGIVTLISMAAYSGIQNRGNTSQMQSYATDVTRKAEAYYATKNTYPTSLADFDTVSESTISNEKSVITNTPITAASTDKIAVYTCGEEGVAVEYWSSQTNAAAVTFAGTATENSACTQMY